MHVGRWAVVFLAAIALGQAAVRAEEGEGDKARLNLGITVETAGSEAQLPLRLVVPGGAAAGKVQVDVLFPADKLTFVRAVVPSSAADDLQVHADVKPAAGDDPPGQRVLSVSVVAGPSRPVPPDLVTTLVFKIGDKATPEVLPVGLRRGQVWSFPDVTRAITPVETFDGRVGVQTLDVFACFFYMH